MKTERQVLYRLFEILEVEENASILEKAENVMQGFNTVVGVKKTKKKETPYGYRTR